MYDGDDILQSYIKEIRRDLTQYQLLSDSVVLLLSDLTTESLESNDKSHYSKKKSIQMPSVHTRVNITLYHISCD